MRSYTIDADNNIIVYGSRKAAAEAHTGIPFTSEDNLAERIKADSKRLVEIWNGLTGVTPVKKFANSAVASRRIMAELEKLGTPTTPAEPEPGNPQGIMISDSGDVIAGVDGPTGGLEAPATRKSKGAKKAATAAPHAGAASKMKAAKATSNGTGPREGSKAARVIELLRRKNGVTLSELMSAGGALTKKHGLTVISSKGTDGDRVYTLAK
jgi:hypothetical protein